MVAKMKKYQSKTTPMAHQKKALGLSAGKKAFAFFMDTRTGKTKVTLDDIGGLYASGKIDCAIVLGPNGSQRIWRDQLRTHFDPSIEWHLYMWEQDPKAKYLAEELERFKARTQGLLIFAANIEAVSAKAYEHIYDLLKTRRCAFIIDESHRIGDSKATQTRYIIKLGAMATYRRILTGTPDGGDPIKLYPQFQFLDPGILKCSSPTAFKSEYCKLLDEDHPLIRHAAAKIAQKNPKMDARKMQKIIQIVERDKEGRPIYRNLDQLHRLTSPHVFRVKKEECFDLPPKTFNVRYVELTKRQRAIYALVQNEIEAEFIHEKKLRRISTAIKITRMLRSQQIVGNYYTADPPENFDFEIPKRETVRIEKPEDNPRLQAVFDIIEEGSRAPTVIWARFRPEIDELVQEIDKKYGRGSAAFIDGRVKGDAREAARVSFQEGRVNFLVAQTRAGIGFDLYRAETVIYYSNTYSMIDRKQSEDRTDSFQRKHQVAVYDLEAVGTSDRAIVECLRMRKEIAAVLEGGMSLADILKGADPK